MKLQKVNTNVEITVESFIAAYCNIGTSVLQAAFILAELLAKDADVFKKIRKLQPTISLNVLGNLLRVGRGEKAPQLLFDDSHAAKYLFDCPLEVQQAAYKDGLPVVCIEGEKLVARMKQVHEVTPTECKLVFDQDRVRPKDEQTAILKSKIVMGTFQPGDRYEFTDDGEVIVLKKTRLNASTLEKMLEQVRKIMLKNLEKNVKQGQIKRSSA